MFDGDRTKKAKPAPLKRAGTVKQISSSVLFSCWAASLIIAIVAVSEAVGRFGEKNTSGGAIYVVVAVLGVLFSVFITVMNRRNKKLLKQPDKKAKNR